MRTYFANHSIIEYSGQKIRNIIHSARLVPSVLESAETYPYTIEDGDTPTTIAHNYYGSIDYVWLVLLANNINDVYSQWHKSQAQFDAYLIKKYGSVQEAMALIHHWKSSDASLPLVSTTTYTYMTAGERTGLSSVYAYDYESGVNVSRMRILLVSNSKASKISYELEKLLK